MYRDGIAECQINRRGRFAWSVDGNAQQPLGRIERRRGRFELDTKIGRLALRCGEVLHERLGVDVARRLAPRDGLLNGDEIADARRCRRVARFRRRCHR